MSCSSVLFVLSQVLFLSFSTVIKHSYIQSLSLFVKHLKPLDLMGTAKADMLSEVKDLHSNSNDQPSSITDDGIVANILHPIDKRSLRKYTWKCDLHLLPLLSVLYLFK